MKSGKQRRQEIKAKRTKRKDLARAAAQRLAQEAEAKQAQIARIAAASASNGVWVDMAALGPNGSLDIPDFVQRGYYVDTPFTCKDCGKTEVWTASQQKWWYEVAKGGVWTIAQRCRPCRQRERKRREQARKNHLEGLARKQATR